jgi:hypothetical protein
VPVPATFLFQWFITWVILAVVFFIAADSMQRYLYEAVVEKLAWRVLAVTPILAAVLVAWPLPFQEMFFSLSRMFLQAVLWFLACWLGLRFLLPHAAAAGIIAVMTIAPVASSSVESLTNKLFSSPAPEASLRLLQWTAVWASFFPQPLVPTWPTASASPILRSSSAAAGLARAPQRPATIWRLARPAAELSTSIGPTSSCSKTFDRRLASSQRTAYHFTHRFARDPR